MYNTILIFGCLFALFITKSANGYIEESQNSISPRQINYDNSDLKNKAASFRDPSTGYVYKVISYNSTFHSNYKSFIRVYKIKLNEQTRVPIGQPENVHTITFHSTLVDFDLNCAPTHCYLVAVTSRSKRNVELYTWKRTQFDLLAKKDSFARPHSVKLFKIRPKEFYIAIAQEQSHLSSSKLQTNDEDEPIKFIGCAVLKFISQKDHDHNIKYHQYIRLPFNPHYVNHFTSINANTAKGSNVPTKQHLNHYLVFSIEPDWNNTISNSARTFIWSPLNDYFWPYKLPAGVVVSSKPGASNAKLKFPLIENYDFKPISDEQPKSIDWNQPVEACFNQLQRLLSERDIQAHQLISSSQSLWRHPQNDSKNINDLTTISARVVVHGDVIVKGNLIRSPQITLFGNRAPPTSDYSLSHMINAHSPAIVENRLKQAFYKLNHIREKLAKAVTAIVYPNTTNQFNSRIRFFGNLMTKRVIFNSGVVNSNVRINGIPFKQLEHELVGLRGSQDIVSKVIFKGNVVADFLEIYGAINKEYYLKDAVDIKSNQIQVIDVLGHNLAGPTTSVAFEFASVSSKNLIMSHNVSFNGIKLNEFITRDNKTQFIYGRKSFKTLSMNQLTLAHSNVLLNGYNISNIAAKALHLRGPEVQSIYGDHLTFSKQIKVGRLFVNNLINRYINMSSIIHDSVKADDMSLQQISGHKFFSQGLKINHLTTDGAINQVLINQIFNLNPTPPVADYFRYKNNSYALLNQNPISGIVEINNTVTVVGNLNTGQINGIDVGKRAIRRFHDSNIPIPLQVVSGEKIFFRPVRVINSVRLFNSSNRPYPLINGFDLRSISSGIMRQMQNPSLIYIDNLEIDGNFNLPTSLSQNYNMTPRTTLGSYKECPLDLIRTRIIAGGNVNQIIDVPIKINTLRARSITLDPYSFNNLNFPADFALRSNGDARRDINEIEPIYGQKYFEHLVIVPSLTTAQIPFQINQPTSNNNNILFGVGSSINNITHSQLQTFIINERHRNSTGETVLQIMNVYGNIFVKRINGQYWPDDILLKSIASNRVPIHVPYLHKRIYSPLIFIESSYLDIENQLVLRGPIQLGGLMNSINLTEFARQSVTYGDKDLLSSGRPIKNKIFLGGISVTGHFRSQGLIDGINIDHMRDRVVTIRPSSGVNYRRILIMSPKMFLSDVQFVGPVSTVYMNDLPIDNYLKRISFQTNVSDNIIRVAGKKTISGSLKINKNLLVQGLINGVDFVDLQAKAISLSPNSDDIHFNRTLTIDGDVFMDNLYIDEKNGFIDGVKLTNLLPMSPPNNKNELIIDHPVLTTQNFSHGYNLNLVGQLNDCQITCTMTQLPKQQGTAPKIPYSPVIINNYSTNQPQLGSTYNQQRIVNYNGNTTFMRTTPPYAQTSYIPLQQQILLTQHRPILQPLNLIQPPSAYSTGRSFHNLAIRRPTSIQYERPTHLEKYLPIQRDFVFKDPQIQEQLNYLRSHIVSLNLIQLRPSSDLVIGFIEAGFNDLSSYIMPEESPHFGHSITLKSFLQLDQTDFPFSPTIYHIAVGVSTASDGRNETSVYSSLGGGENEFRQLSTLPIESPNSAMFVKIADQRTLFLLISQDYTIYAKNQGTQCPRYWTSPQSPVRSVEHSNYDKHLEAYQIVGGVHVYLFHALHNSSSLTSAYFDLYQTLDLPSIDGFESFNYHGSTYAIAVSRLTNKIYLLLLRGYSGFQVVSHMDAANIESTKVLYTEDKKPMLVIYQTNGLHRLMESVII